MDAVVKFRTRYSAAQLHLQNLSGDERSRQSSQQAASLMTWMKSLPPLTQNQKHQYLAVVVSQEQGWETKDRVEEVGITPFRICEVCLSCPCNPWLHFAEEQS